VWRWRVEYPRIKDMGAPDDEYPWSEEEVEVDVGKEVGSKPPVPDKKEPAPRRLETVDIEGPFGKVSAEYDNVIDDGSAIVLVKSGEGGSFVFTPAAFGEPVELRRKGSAPVSVYSLGVAFKDNDVGRSYMVFVRAPE
jgi:hypothetical protein